MNSLVSYGSDENSDDSGDERFPEMPGRQKFSMATHMTNRNYKKPSKHEDNYEEVGMDMSEDSNDSNPVPPVARKPTDEARDRSDPYKRDGQRDNARDNNPFYASNRDRNSSPPVSSSGPDTSGNRSPKNRKEDDRRGSKPEDRYRGGRRDDNRGSRDSRDEDKSKERNRDDDRRDRDRDKDRRDSRDDRRDSRRDDRSRDDRYSRDRRDRDRDRDRRRSRSRDRRRSRSPRRSRSGSRDRGKGGFRRDKADRRMNRLDKLGIEFKPDNYPASALREAEEKLASGNSGDRFFMPGITGRFREQIEKRKQLWQKGKEQEPSASAAAATVAPKNGAPVAGGSKACKVYEATTFADDKTSNKFKRLMGIKDTTDASNLPVKGTDILKKQQEMFSSMEAQYEVARTATHTMRGVGLGFGSFQR